MAVYFPLDITEWLFIIAPWSWYYGRAIEDELQRIQSIGCGRRAACRTISPARGALVAGATRGAGRGIAIALGEAGATVYCTGRSSRKHSRGRSPTPGRPETIEETAELVTAAGGRGIAVRVDHEEPAEVKKLVAR